MKNVIVLSDLHSGSVVGLTPSNYIYTDDHEADREVLFGVFLDMLDKFRNRYGPIDICIVNGDCVDGKSSRWAGTGVVTHDIHRQIEIAQNALLYVDAKHYVFTYGTPYHGGGGDDWEKTLADKFSAEIKAHAFINIEGVNFSVKHKVSSSTIPHGRSTPAKRERLWNMIWHVEKKQCPLADVIIRSHVHYFDFSGNASYLALTTPALQGLGSKYGSRECAGTVDFGIVWFRCWKGEYKWGWDVALVEEQQDSVIVF